MARADEVIDLVTLLLAHADAAAGTREEIEATAERVAVACLGENHLWQDLQFASRAELSALIAEKCIEYLEGPIVRVAGFDTPFPYTLEPLYMPDSKRVLAGIEKTYVW